jgi:hypothetical protein
VSIAILGVAAHCVDTLLTKAPMQKLKQNVSIGSGKHAKEMQSVLRGCARLLLRDKG